MELVVDYPDAFDPERLSRLQDIIQKETGWKLSLSNSFNHQMASLFVQQLFPGRISKISHFDQLKQYTVKLTGSEEADEKKQVEFHTVTGWSLVLTADGSVTVQQSKDTKGWYFPCENGTPMEQNNAFRMIDRLFLKQEVRPYKKGLRTDQYGKFYDLSFLSPVIAEQCTATLQECADEIHLRVHVADSVNQNVIQTMLMELCAKYEITIAKTPSWLPAQSRFELRTEQELPEEMVREFK